MFYFRIFPLVLFLIFLMTFMEAGACNYEVCKWPSPSVTMKMGFLESPFNTAFVEACSTWTNGTGFSIATNGSPADPCVSPSGGVYQNGVKFSSTYCGDPWDSTTLATTLMWYRTSDNVMVQAGIVFNGSRNWSVYHGSLQAGVEDFRRVAIHELGHVIGLDHETSSTSIMYPYVSDVEAPTSYDVTCVKERYSLGSTSSGYLVNISTRAFVGTGDKVLIGGFIVSGGSARVVVRALGPSLANYGVSGTVADPQLYIYSSSGQLVASNDDWISNPQMSDISQLNLAPTNSKESAVILNLSEGGYTAVVMGANSSTGVALVEVFKVE